MFNKVKSYEVVNCLTFDVSDEVETAMYNALHAYALSDEVNQKAAAWDYMRGVLNSDLYDRDFSELIDILQEDEERVIAYACTYRDTYDTGNDYLIAVIVRGLTFAVCAFEMYYYTDTTLQAYKAEEPETEADAWARLCE